MEDVIPNSPGAELQARKGFVVHGVVVHLVDRNTEEGSGLFVRVSLELGVESDAERGSHGGKQVSLPPELARVRLSDTQESHTPVYCPGIRRTSL